MITQRDIDYVAKIAPVAQLLELFAEKIQFYGGKDPSPAREPEVFEEMAGTLWGVFTYLRERLEDEKGVGCNEHRSESYFRQLDAKAKDVMA
jgi:hypothetical protein